MRRLCAVKAFRRKQTGHLLIRPCIITQSCALSTRAIVETVDSTIDVIYGRIVSGTFFRKVSWFSTIDETARTRCSRRLPVKPIAVSGCIEIEFWKPRTILLNSIFVWKSRYAVEIFLHEYRLVGSEIFLPPHHCQRRNRKRWLSVNCHRGQIYGLGPRNGNVNLNHRQNRASHVTYTHPRALYYYFRAISPENPTTHWYSNYVTWGTRGRLYAHVRIGVRGSMTHYRCGDGRQVAPVASVYPAREHVIWKKYA